MKSTLFRLPLWVCVLAAVLLVSCKKEEESKIIHIDVSADAETKIQEAMVDLKEGWTIELGAGTFAMDKGLTMRDLSNVTFKGNGSSSTILDFTNQSTGAQGVYFDNVTHLTIQGFTIKNSKSDGVKAKACNGVSFIDVAAVWDQPLATNGGYGLYPVSSKNVLMDNCYSRAASDAGIYVGQCDGVIMKNCRAELNVAGIEIENTLNADVYDNHPFNNTGGILVFDNPGLLQKNGGNVRVYNNNVDGNNHENFANVGSFVAEVPPGTGVLILAMRNVEVFNNNIHDNNRLCVGIINFNTLQALDSQFNYDDPSFNPYASAINIHDNTILRDSSNVPSDGGRTLALVLNGYFGNNPPEIMFDGFSDPANAGIEAKKVCARNNGNVKYVNLHIEKGPDVSNFTYDISEVDCTHDPLPAITLQ